jgi:iron complex transport system substrate-binding protein
MTKLVAAACALVLLATACGERSEPTGALVPLYPVSVQGAGERPAIVSAAPRRIAPLGSAPAKIVKALGAGSRLVHVDTSLTGAALVHALARVRPDLIVAPREASAIDLARARSQTHAPVYVTPDSSIDEVEEAIDDLGLLVDKPLPARELIQSIERQRQRVKTRLAGKPVVSVFVDTGFFSTISDHSLLGDLVREAHGRSVAGASVEPGQPFDLARLARIKPAVYLATSDSETTLASLVANPRTRSLPAVRSHRFGVIPVALVQPGPRIGAGLQTVAQLLHPDAFR